MPMMQALLTSADAARRLGVTPATVRLWERLGRLPATRTLSGTRLFTQDDVERLADARAADNKEPRETAR
jgi:excisionase family DNA binding protein